MKKQPFILILFLAFSSLLLNAQEDKILEKSNSYNMVDTTERFVSIGNLKFRDFNKNGKLDIYEDYRKPINERAQDLLSKMTMDEKLAQLKCPWMGNAKLFRKNKFRKDRAFKYFPNGLGEVFQVSNGNYILSKPKTPSSSEIPHLVNQLQNYFINDTRLGIPALFSEEALHGLVIKDGTMFPSALGMACSWNEDLTYDVFESIATEARNMGIHRLLAPVLDLGLDPRWGRIEETMGEDPYLTSRLGLAKVNGLQGNSGNPDREHVAVMLKHLGAHGQPEGGSNAGPVFISERQLREVNFKPFKAAVMEGKALGVMACYNEISGIPTHANRWMLTDVLRDEWGFEGIVNSDYNATRELIDYHHIAADKMEAGSLAIKAGVDLEQTDRFMFESLPEAIEKEIAEIDDLNKAVIRILELKLRLNIFEQPFIEVQKKNIVGSEKHRELALQSARESMVLLKNENNILPLDRKKYKKIAIIGPNADECNLGGYSHIPRTKISPLEAIKEKYKDIEVVYAQGCNLTVGKESYTASILTPREKNLKLIKEAVDLAKDADIIILILGGNHAISREATRPQMPGDLVNLELLGQQNELIDSLNTLKKPMVAFVFSGPPISFMHLKQIVPAIVQCWYLGQETGYAVAETLFGDNNPSGKLTISIPRSAAHLPSYYYSKPTARVRPYHFDSITPMYPFGYGLSYTTFEYSNLKISKSEIMPDENVTVTVNVQNTGTRKG